MADERLLTVREVSERLSLREPTLRRWIQQRRIPYCKLSRAVRIPASVVDKMIEESLRKPGVLHVQIPSAQGKNGA